jgi:integrase
MSIRHEILGGKVQVYRRKGPVWQCSTTVGGKQYRATTKREELRQACDIAEDWYLELRGKFKRGDAGKLEVVNGEKLFKDAAEEFIREFPIMTDGQRNAQYVKGHERRLRKNLIPFFGEKGLSQVTSGLIHEYRLQRMEAFKAKYGKPLARQTLHQEIVVLRQVLKLAIRKGDLSALPDLTQPYRNNAKISHRAWFSHDEYKLLYQATRERTNNPPHATHKNDYEDLHDYVLFMVNTGLRPDESHRVHVRDVNVVYDAGSKETILEIDIRGKRGTGFCKSMPGAVLPFERIVKRHKLGPTDLVFPKRQQDLFNTILTELKLKIDREGQRRTFYSLRHTYICFRLMEGADVYQIAKNCRTSVKMIEDFYASHIKNMVDASVVNVRRPKPRPVAKPRTGKAAKGKKTTQTHTNPL